MVAFVVVMALGSTVGAGAAGAQTAPSPTDALCGEDPLAALPPEFADLFAPFAEPLLDLAGTFCDLIPEGGGLPGLPEGGAIPGIDDVVATFCGAIEDGLAAVPPPLDAATAVFAPFVDAFCGDGTGAPTDPSALCVPIDTFVGLIPAEFQAALAPLTGLFEQLAATFCSLIPGVPEGEPTPPAPDGGSQPAPEGGPAPGGPGVLSSGAESLPRTGGTSVPLAGGAALAALAGALRWGLRSRRS
jgi:hypothetical protein